MDYQIDLTAFVSGIKKIFRENGYDGTVTPSPTLRVEGASKPAAITAITIANQHGLQKTFIFTATTSSIFPTSFSEKKPSSNSILSIVETGKGNTESFDYESPDETALCAPEITAKRNPEQIEHLAKYLYARMLLDIV